jgi:hypothetical protein
MPMAIAMPREGDVSARPSIDEVWGRIRAHQGETFHTKTGLPLTYTVTDNRLTTSRSHVALSVTGFSTVLKRVPVASPAHINSEVRGPSYIWAILHDPRIRQADW